MYGNSKRAFVYCRVSTEEQGTEDHHSLDYQEEKARLRVQEKNWALIKVRKDVGSGKGTKDRPGFQELVRDIKQGNIDVVIVYKLDRLSRNVGDIYDFIKNESLGIRKIARRLNTQGLRTKGGNQFGHSDVWRILSNPVYKGVIRYNDDFEVDGKHEAIVDEELFDEVHRKLTQKQKVHPRRRYSQLLLAGIAKCATCGKTLRTHYKSKHSKSYECMGNTLVGEEACPGFRKVDYRVDNAVLDRIMNLANDEVIQNMAVDELDELLEDNLGPLHDELGTVQSELGGIGQTFNRWADRLDRGLITEEQFAARNEKLLGKQARLEFRRDQIFEKLEAGERTEVEFEQVTVALEKFPSLWEEATLEERKELMGLLIENLEVGPTEVTVKVRFLEESMIPIKLGR